MANPKELQLFPSTGGTIYVRVNDDMTYETRRQPTTAELATAKSALSSGYTWAIVNPVSGTTATFNRVLYIGNSILQHGGAGNFFVNAQNPSRGMAATAPDKDFFRLLSARHKGVNPAVVNRRLSDFGVGEETLSAATGPFIETILTGDGNTFYNEIQTRFAAVQAWKPDLVYVRFGENVNDGAIPALGGEFVNRLKAFIDKLILGSTGAKVIVSTSVWGGSNFDAAIRTVATDRNYPLADFSDMWPNRASNGYYAFGVYNDDNISKHPNDAGMARIAQGLWSVTPQSTVPVVTPPVTPTTPINSLGASMYAGDTFNYTDMAETSRSNPFPVFENDKVKVVLALRDQYPTSNEKGMGGSVFQLYDKRKPNKTLIYNAVVWNGEDQGAPRTPGQSNRVFTGQGLSECLYLLPRPFYTTGETGQGPHDPSLGVNPNEVGDDEMASGRLIKYGASGNTFFTEMMPMFYGQRQAPASDVRFKKWGTLNERALTLNYESTFNRSTNAQVVAKAQEGPCLYTNNMRFFKFYRGNSPYSNDGITTYEAPLSNGNGSGSGLNGQRNAGNYVTEPWIWNGDGDGIGVGLFLKDNIRTVIGWFGDGGGNDSEPNKGGSYGFIAHHMIELLDHNIKWRHRTEVIVGTAEELRAYVYASQYRPVFKPNYKFNTPGRQGWNLNSGNWDEGSGSGDHHTWDEHFTGNNRNGWKVFFGQSSNAQIISPGLIWKTAEFNKIYVRMAFTGQDQPWELHFIRNGQKPDGNLNTDPGSNKFYMEENFWFPNNTADTDAQKVYTTVQGDGQYRVYEFNVGAKSAWQGIVNLIKLKPHATAGRYSYNANEYAVIDWISDSPSGPSN